MDRGTSHDVVARVKDAVDIVDVVGDRIPLKQRGRSFIALCPFHAEKTPSFHVHSDRQFYHCFGCGAGGDVLRFVQDFDKLTFGEALDLLASRVGITIERGRSRDGASTSQRGRLLKLLEWSCHHFEQQLSSESGQEARSYLEKRGLGERVAQTFRMGFAPPGWDHLLQRAQKQGIEPKELEEAGLVTARSEGSGYYDRFRGRLMFPIADATGKIVGFGARSLGDEEPKYLNSPEGPLFSKRRLLYGLNQARKQFTPDHPPVVVEGYTDVMAAHQAGFGQAVATLGTALTPDHARVLKRYGSSVVLVFDGDSAGKKAAERGSEVFAQADIDLRVAVLPSGQDPCDLLTQEGGPEAFQAELDRSAELIEFLLIQIAERFDVTTVAGRARAADELIPLVTSVRDPLRQSLYFQRVAESLKVEEAVLRRRAKAMRAPARPRDTRVDDAGMSATATQPELEPSPVTKRRMRAEEEILESFVRDSSLYVRALEEACRLDLEPLTREDFQHGPHQALFDRLRPALEAGDPVSVERLVSEDGELWRTMSRVLARPGGEERDLEAQFYGALGRLLLERMETIYRDLKEKRSEVLARQDDTEIAEYLRAAEAIRRRIERFRGEWLGIGLA